MPIQYAASPDRLLSCPVCGIELEVRLAKGRRSGKDFLMAVCPKDGRHIRAFINDQGYVRQVLTRLEARQDLAADADAGPDALRRSETDLERPTRP